MSPATVALTRAVQTSSACPSQWDAWDADGNQYYLRYRWGQGSVAKVTQSSSGRRHETLTLFDHGDGLDGVIDLEDFARLAHLDISQISETS